MSVASLTNSSSESGIAVFISYSRQDHAFVDRLGASLRARGIRPLVDRTEIYALEDWWQRLEGLITKADIVVFALSPAWVSSEVCRREADFAVSLNKRLAPVVCQSLLTTEVPRELARLNFVFLDDDAQFEEGIERLIQALETDIDWIRSHTEFGALAQRWLGVGRPDGLLLRSPALEEAELWLATRPPDAPAPTGATAAFIVRSRVAATRRRSLLMSGLASGLVIASALAGLAYWQWMRAAEQRDQALIAQSYFLTDRSRAEARSDDPTLASLFALAALPDRRFGIERPLVPAAKLALLSSLQQLGDVTLRGHTAPLQSAVFSPDGKRVATTSHDRTARIWEAATGRPLFLLAGHNQGITTAVFSPDGRRLVTASRDKTARLWDADSGGLISILAGHDGSLTDVVFSNNGDRIATASEDGSARVWNGANGTLLHTMNDHHGKVVAAIFTPDGRKLVTASNDFTAKIWAVESGVLLTTLTAHSGPITAIAVSHDGLRIATASDDKDVRVWETESGKPMMRFSGNDDGIKHVAFSPDGTHLLSVVADDTIRIWNAASAVDIGEIASTASISSAAFSPDGTRIVVGSADKSVRIWSIYDAKMIMTLKGHAGAVSDARFSPDGKTILSASFDGTARLWNLIPGFGAFRLQTIVPANELQPRNVQPIRADFTFDGKAILAASDDGALRLWRVDDGALLHTYSPSGATIAHAAAITRDRARWFFGGFGSPFIAGVGSDASVVKLSGTATGSSQKVFSAAFDADGMRLVTTNHSVIATLWNANDGTIINHLSPHSDKANKGKFQSADFSLDGRRIVSAHDDGEARIWDATTGSLITVLPAQSQHSLSVAVFSPDSQLVAAASKSPSGTFMNAPNTL
jgi:WD40 repeat protein